MAQYIDAQTEGDIALQKKQHILSLLKHLNSEPLRPAIADESSQTQTLALSLANDHIEAQIKDLLDPTSLITAINEELAFHQQLDLYIGLLLTPISELKSDNITTNLNKAHQLLTRINELKEKSRILSSYIKLVINQYLFNVEFSHVFNSLDEDALKSRKQRFLKLLETLLNNNILNINREKKFVTLQSLDDPLVRFLIVNRIVSVIPPNKIVLKDLSFNL